MIQSQARGPRRRGAAVVELAAVLPLIILLIIGVWELGRMCEIQQITNNAAREGARQASTGLLHAGEPPQDQVERVVRLYLENAFQSAGVADASTVAANATVTVENLDQQPNLTDPFYYVDGRMPNVRQGDRLKVTVTVPLQSVRWISLYLVTSEDTKLTASIVWPCMADKPFPDVSEPTFR